MTNILQEYIEGVYDKLYPYQIDFLNSDKVYRIIAAGRQSGKTTVAYYEAIFRCLLAPKSTVYWVSPTYDISQIAFDRITERDYEGHYINLPETMLARKEDNNGYAVYFNAHKIKFKNGSEIFFRSADGKGGRLRGATADLVIIDEAGNEGISDELFNALLPFVLVRKGKFVLVGTPDSGDRGFFYGMYQKALQHPETYGLWHLTTEQANPSIDIYTLRAQRELMTRDEYEKYYNAKFISLSDTSVFKHIRACISNNRGMEDGVNFTPRATENSTQSKYMLGWDIAIKSDYSVYTIVDITKQPYHIVNITSIIDKDVKEQIALLDTLVRQYNPITISIDSTAMGAVFIDLLKGKDYYKRVSKIEFTKHKRELVHNLQLLFEHNSISLPNPDISSNHRQTITNLINELENYKREVTSSGYIKYHNGKGTHDDMVDSLMLALYPQSKIWKPKSYAFTFDPFGRPGLRNKPTIINKKCMVCNKEFHLEYSKYAHKDYICINCIEEHNINTN